MQKNNSGDFITMGDEKYIQPLLVAAHQISKLHPQSTYFIYDCGLSQESVSRLKSVSDNIVISHWTLRYLPVKQHYSNSFMLMKCLGMFRDLLLNTFTKNNQQRSLDSFIRQYDFEIKIQNKLQIIKFHNDEHQSPFIFLDADAFPVNKLDEVFEADYDIGLTLRPKEDQSDSYNNCRLLNVGFMAFVGTYEINKTLINEWSTWARRSDELCSEQTSLTRLLQKFAPELFQDKINVEMALQGMNIKIAFIPYNIYNYTKIELLSVPKDLQNIKILHFKNDRFSSRKFSEIANALELFPQQYQR